MKKKRPTPKHTKLTDADLAKRYGVSTKTIARWRASGAPLTDPKEMEQWLCARRQLPVAALPGLREARLQEVQERIRRLRLANDRLEGTLVARDWVCAKISCMCLGLKELEHRSIEQHPLRLAGAGGDVAAIRAVLREIWGEICDGLQQLGEHLREGDE